MNRLIAKAFAGILPVLHLMVLGLLSVAAFTDVLNLPGEGAREIAVGLAFLVAYLLFAGVTSTLVRMADAMDKMATNTVSPASSVNLSKTPAPTATLKGRQEPALAAHPSPKGPTRKEPTLATVRINPEREQA